MSIRPPEAGYAVGRKPGGANTRFCRLPSLIQKAIYKGCNDIRGVYYTSYPGGTPAHDSVVTQVRSTTLSTMNPITYNGAPPCRQMPPRRTSPRGPRPKTRNEKREPRNNNSYVIRSTQA